MMQRADVRPAGETDVKRIAEIEGECFTDPWSEKLIMEAMDSDSAEIYVIEKSGEIAGFMVLSSGYEDMSVDNIAVSPEHRRQGLARELLMFAHRKYEGISFLLEVRESNESAINLYKSLGYERVGYRRRYYHSPEEGAVLMTRSPAEKL